MSRFYNPWNRLGSIETGYWAKMSLSVVIFQSILKLITHTKFAKVYKNLFCCWRFIWQRYPLLVTGSPLCKGLFSFFIKKKFNMKKQPLGRALNKSFSVFASWWWPFHKFPRFKGHLEMLEYTLFVTRLWNF